MKSNSHIATQIVKIKNDLPDTARLVAVSKFHPCEAIKEAYDAGQRLFGESRAQELKEKYEQLPKDIEWHFIGHLQVNKVKYIAPFVSLVHSVDSIGLLKEINRQASKYNRTIDCLLEIHVAQETTKYGLTFDECTTLLQSEEFARLEHIRIKGFMGMASYTDDTAQIEQEFHQLGTFFRQLRDDSSIPNTDICELSMGMSHDYLLALKEGATLVRIGTTIFGERIY